MRFRMCLTPFGYGLHVPQHLRALGALIIRGIRHIPLTRAFVILLKVSPAIGRADELHC